MKRSSIFFLSLILLLSCKKTPAPLPAAEIFNVTGYSINGNRANIQYNIGYAPVIKISFSAAVNRSLVPNNVLLNLNGGAATPVSYTYQNSDSTVILQPLVALAPISKYNLFVSTNLLSTRNTNLQSAFAISFITQIDSTDKFPILSDNQLLDTVQRRTFRYFWEFGHPVSGMARERNSSGDLVTTGGTGFGIMSMIAAANRNFITRTEARDRILLISNFLINNCTRYHGAFAHWINGASGATIPFSSNDNGADLVETSFLMEGLITARQYFNTADAGETDLRNKINTLLNAVEWNWFRQNSQNVLYWHWSPDKAWTINAQVRGWNEAMITYVMASSSLTDSIPKIAYDIGWAVSGNIRNNNSYYGYQLPLGPSNGGPLFFEHYSFLGINPNGLSDAYANYQTQTVNHTKINYEYCKANPRGWNGYSNLCWGLTASDVPTGYHANEPNSDPGVISPTAALSSIPYTPAESMNALKFFYYKLGDKIWGQYGFVDAFKLSDPWFANSTLAIDQGPIIVMIENYRSGLLWNLFTSAPEIKNGMKRLGFTAPYL
ncbi:MAG: Ig-like domain-containing protein [Bacteroidia bacterium]|nr:Ig-like domain-containing protein [Bacteroidia bacterium]